MYCISYFRHTASYVILPQEYFFYFFAIFSIIPLDRVSAFKYVTDMRLSDVNIHVHMYFYDFNEFSEF